MHASGPLILEAEALAGDADGDLFGLDQVAAEAAKPAASALVPLDDDGAVWSQW